jgi:group II intron reverse transcriptase/maturase
MGQLSLNLNYDRNELFEAITSERQLEQAFKLVSSNRGAPGVDGVTIDQFEANLKEEIHALSQEVKEWKYKPKPVKRVEIPKPGKQEKRKLGIPCVKDRVVQASIKLSLEPIFEKGFSESSYGFRPERNQKQAIEQAKKHVESGKGWVVDLDLEKFFDRINQDRLMYLLAKEIPDKRVLKLIGMTLHSGVLHHGEFEPSLEGSVQGSPLSPLLSNIVLDELDKELERRGLAFCRYADDANIFVGSQKAAQRILETITNFIEKRLKLKVNQTKSKAALASAVKFLGTTIACGMIIISTASMKHAYAKVRELIPRRTHIPLEKQVEQVNRWYQGWSSYYQITEMPSQLKAVEARIRRRFRAQLIRHHKNRRSLIKKLRQMGVPPRMAQGSVSTNRKTQAQSHTLATSRAWSNKWFEKLGLISVLKRSLPHWKPIDVWIKSA